MEGDDGTRYKPAMPRKKKAMTEFGQFFHVDRHEPLNFRMRRGADGRHDAIFLSSYLHDAHFKIGGMQRRAKRITIDLQRDTWETYQRTGDMKKVPCRLTLEPVVSIRWRFGDDLAAAVPDLRNAKLSICDFRFQEVGNNDVLMLSNPSESFELEVNFGEACAAIQLQDLA